MPTTRPRILLLSNTDWYLYNFRIGLARYLEECGLDIHLASPNGVYRGKLESLGFQWHELSLQRGNLNLLNEVQTYKQIQQLYRRLQPNLVHNFTLQCVVWGSLAANMEGGPLIVNALTGMGSIFRGESLKGRLLRLPIKALLGKALRTPRSLTIVQNPEDQEMICRLFGLPVDRVSLIKGSGIDVHRFRPKSNIPPGKRVLFAGRLLKDKGLLVFLSACQRLHETHPEIEFLVAGVPDPKSPSSFKEIEYESIKQAHPYVKFLGHVEDMPALYASCHLSVLPTSYGEGVPKALIEAAACGLPLIASNHPGCREIVRPGENGILLSDNTWTSLTQAILSILNDRQTWNTYSRNSCRIASDDFSEALVFSQTIQVYRQLGLSFTSRY